MITQTELNELISETGKPCVSIVAPAHRLSPGRTLDPQTLEKLVDAAKNLLKMKVDKPKEAEKIISKIDALAEKIDFVHAKDGIGIFASSGFSKLVHFPFPVTNKVKAGDSFFVKDILYLYNNSVDYYAIAITKKSVRLFKAQGEECAELKNADFPFEFNEEYEYARPSRGTSYSNTRKNFERDKSVMEEIRLKDFLRHADSLLGKYITGQTPLIIAGGKKETADFLKVTRHENNIIGKVTGNYTFNGDAGLKKHMWEEMQHYINTQHRTLISELSESIGKNMAVAGIKEVWKAANDGKGLKLVVEKDFETHGFISKDGLNLKFAKPASGIKEYIFEPDIVEGIIRMVLEKGGNVVFVEKDELKHLNRIAMLLRYP